MSDSKKPTVSEIRAEAYLSPIHVPYLLDLVSRMGEGLEVSAAAIETKLSCCADKDTEFVQFWQKWLTEARALLLELKQ